MKLMFPKLNGENYFNWKFKMEMYLRKEKIWPCITNGPPEIPEEEADNSNAQAITTAQATLRTYNENSEQARALIGLCVEDGQLAHIRNATTAKEAWENLQKHFERDTLSNKVSIIRRISRTQLQEGGDMEQHLVQMINLFQKLADLGADQLDDEWKVGFVLSSLPPSYDTLVTALEVREDLTFAIIHSKLISEHLKRKGVAAANTSSNEQQQQLALKVTHQNIKCFFCKKGSHIKKDCIKYKEWLKKKQNQNKNGDKVNKIQENEFLFQVTSKSQSTASNDWTMDSAATSHVSGNKKLFDSLDLSQCSSVTMANNNTECVKGKGTCAISMTNESGDLSSKELNDVLYTPNVLGNLISVGKLMTEGFAIIFANDKCEIQKNDEQVAVADYIDGLFKLRRPQQINSCTENEHKQNCLHYWHRVFGHRDPAAIKTMVENDLVSGMKLIDCGIQTRCETCMKAKTTRLPFPKKSLTQSKAILDLIHTDVCGPMQTESCSKKRYLLTVIDDYSKYTVVYFLREKSETAQKIKEYIAMVKNIFGKIPKIIRSDNGGEYIAQDLRSFLKTKGIRQQFTAPYTPQQNGVAERKNRSLIEMTRCMLEDSGLPKFLWAEAVNTANFIQNRTITKGANGIPFQLWKGAKPNVQRMEIFGTKCFVHIPSEKRKKLENTAKEAYFIGYDECSKAFRLYDKVNHKVIVSRDVRFANNPSHSEHILIELHPKLKTKVDDNNNNDDDNGSSIDSSDVSNSSSSSGAYADADDEQSEFDVTLTGPDMNYRDENDSDSNESEKSESSTDSEITVVPVNFETNLDIEYDELSTSFSEFSMRESASEFELTQGQINSEDTEIESEVEVVHRQSQRSNKGVAPERYQANMIFEPKTLTEALSDRQMKPKWVQAMQEEMKSMKENDTWDLCELPSGRKAIGCKWVFKTKLDSNGKVQRLKARLVAKGFTQKYGQDYDQVFAPVAKQTTFRVLLSIASAQKLLVHHLDVKTAFLNGKLSETIYMKQPPGFESKNKNLVCRLKRGIYGLKQAAMLWNDEIHRVLTSNGFQRNRADPCLYSKLLNNELVYVLIYVDDMAIVTKTSKTMDQVKSMLKSKFNTQDLGEIKQYLGIQVTRDGDGIFHLNQTQYINKVINDFGLSNAKESIVPITVSYGKSTSGESKSVLLSNEQYQKLLGCLLFIAVNTRPDIAVSVSILAQKVCQPTQEDWNELKRVLKYLKGTANLKLALAQKDYNGDKLYGYSDASWADNKIDRKSIGGHVILLNGASVCWSARKQSMVTLSTCEAEFVALSESCRAVFWIQRLLNDMKQNVTMGTNIFEDNQSCLNLVEQEERLSDRSKHIDTRFHFVKDYIKKGFITCKYCPTEQMLADVFTKPVAAKKLMQFRAKLGLYD